MEHFATAICQQPVHGIKTWILGFYYRLSTKYTLLPSHSQFLFHLISSLCPQHLFWISPDPSTLSIWSHTLSSNCLPCVLMFLLTLLVFFLEILLLSVSASTLLPWFLLLVSLPRQSQLGLLDPRSYILSTLVENHWSNASLDRKKIDIIPSNCGFASNTHTQLFFYKLKKHLVLFWTK